MTTPGKQQEIWNSLSGVQFNPLPWSHTKLTQALSCPLALYLSCTRPRRKNAPPHPDTEIGKQIHELAHILQAGGSATLTMPEDHIFPVEYITNLGKFFRDELPQLKELIGSPCEVHTEVKIRLGTLLEPAQTYPSSYISGVLDLMLYNPEDQSLLLVDYKTGVRVLDDEARERVRQQLKIYALLVHRGLKPVKKAGLIVCHLKEGGVQWLTEGIEEFEETRARQYLRDLVLAAHESIKVIEPRKNSLCEYCDHRLICPLMNGANDADV